MSLRSFGISIYFVYFIFTRVAQEFGNAFVSFFQAFKLSKIFPENIPKYAKHRIEKLNKITVKIFTYSANHEIAGDENNPIFIVHI